MPLRAQLDGQSLNAALLSETQWQALKGSRSLRMPCCDTPAHRRTSRLGTRHFAHSPGGHCGALGECAEHLAAKAEIMRVCHELGWDALSEYIGDKWRADVYAMRGRHRIAFEIQWSPQTLEVTRERHAAYGDDVKCCWLFRRLPSLNQTGSAPYKRQTTAERNLPMFTLSLADSRFDVTAEYRKVSLREFVEARLERRIRFCEQRHFTARELHFVVSKVECWRRGCGCSYDVFYTREVMRSDCGAEHFVSHPGEEDSFDGDPCCALRNWRLAKKIFASEVNRLRFSVKHRWSDTITRSYWCFCCPQCDAMFGHHYFTHFMTEAETDTATPFWSKQLPCSKRQPEPHWCFPLNGAFCTNRRD